MAEPPRIGLDVRCNTPTSVRGGGRIIHFWVNPVRGEVKEEKKISQEQVFFFQKAGNETGSTQVTSRSMCVVIVVQSGERKMRVPG